MKFRSSRFFKVLTVFVLVNFITSLILPTVTWGLTSGPDSPEFSSFTPAGSTEMVNLFTGDFNYNIPIVEIPGPHNSGYAVSLSYNSGSSSETEASWVGLGWTLNPGAINRELRGFPDEYDRKQIDYYNKTRPNWTATSVFGMGASLEIFSKDIAKDVIADAAKTVAEEATDSTSLSVNITSNHRINNYSGYQNITSFGMNFDGKVGIDATLDPNGTTFSPSVSPLVFFKKDKENSEKQSTPNLYGYNYGIGKGSANIGSSLFSFSLSPWVRPPAPYNFPEYSGFSLNWSASVQINPSNVPVGLEGLSRSGSVSFRYSPYHTINSVNGYLYTDQTKAELMSDYYVEKDQPFKKSDLFIGIPFNSNDMFRVSGEGVIGGFRAYKKEVGQITPKRTKSETKIRQIGFEAMFGVNNGIGMDFGIGHSRTTVKPWGDANSTSSEFILRFNNDKGGTIEYDGTDITRTKSDFNSTVPGFKSASHNASALYSLDNIGQSSFIKYNQEDSLFTGFEIIDNKGMEYHYKEPVFIQNETSLSFDVIPEEVEENNYLAFKELKLSKNDGFYNVSDSVLHNNYHKSVIGQINKNKYANTFLLTEVRTPNYIDCDTIPGGSNDDFGGWTRFNYRKTYGENRDNWYRYRMPYNGLLYQQNSISDIHDDKGTVSTGEKEVKYLHTIETKTHIAYFITNKTTNESNPYLSGSQNERLDGIGAPDLNEEYDPAANLNESIDKSELAKLEYLEKIVLYAKNSDGTIDGQKPLKTTYFEYDYSLVPNVVNNLNSNFNYADDGNSMLDRTGKLTLKKVWSEYQGVVPAKISPYVFNYYYPNPASDSKLYEYFSNGGYEFLASGKAQNPSYSPYSLDAWGNNTPNGKERRKEGVFWTDQSAFLESHVYGKNKNGKYYDPAAYQLKSIQIPSGGTIHIQYEAKDYTHVQNRTAMAMARVSGEKEHFPKYDKDTYIINVADLGCDPSNNLQVDQLVEKINLHFHPQTEETDSLFYGKKIYYKFLFSLLNESPSLSNNRSEYISGYANFNGAEKVSLDDGTYGIRISLGSENSNDGERALVPRQACREFVENQRQGKVKSGDCIEPNYERKYDPLFVEAANNSDDGKGTSKYTTSLRLMAQMAVDFSLLAYHESSKYDIGNQINTELSFLKLPVLSSKVGGGARVKAILMHDNGMESGDEVLNGTTYRYEMPDGTSSGIATNEPASAREENPLVGFLPVKGQKWWDKVIAGEVLEQTEGPLGETILPAPSIGHRRVVVENIHTGLTGNGYTENEFYTSYDYPFDKIYNPDTKEGFDFNGSANAKSQLSEKRDDLRILAGLFNYIVARSWITQGFRFVHTNMTGQPKRIATYGGAYDHTGSNPLTSYQEYDYFEPGEYVKVLNMDSNGNLVSKETIPGKEMDMCRESKQIKDVALDFNVEFDISIAISVGIQIFGNAFPKFHYTENLLATHSTSKIINYPAIVKKVTQMADGIVSENENIAFNEHTGEPVITKITDSFEGVQIAGTPHKEGSIYNFNIPASWMYKEMGQKSENTNYTNQLTASTATFSLYETEPDAAWWQNPTNLIQAAVQTYKNGWGDIMAVNQKLRNSYSEKKIIDQKEAINNVWMPHASYSYKNEELPNQINRIYNKGYFDIGANKYNWDSNGEPPLQWIKTSEVISYSPNGESLEEIDVLNIPSAATYGYQYGNNVPVMVAANANNKSILFNDFEIPGSPGNSQVAHSGKRAIPLSTAGNILDKVYVSQILKEQGGLFKVWVYYDSNTMPDFYLNIQSGQDENNSMQLTKTASVGNWNLYELSLDKAYFESSAENSQLAATLSTSTSEEVFIDDVRFQPKLASANCFVYDTNDLKLLTQFDDQHFGTYYQYDEEGKLIRKILETERGKLTVQEMNYNTHKESR
nr:hypothetical protein [uncultured Draconibacterium sp.]